MNNTSAQSPASTVFIHSLIFLFPFLLLITRVGVGLCSFAFLLTALLTWRRGWSGLQRHLTEIRPVLVAFAATLLLALLLGLLSGDGRLRDLETVSHAGRRDRDADRAGRRPSRKALWWA
jgi:O-antigen ligase